MRIAYLVGVVLLLTAAGCKSKQRIQGDGNQQSLLVFLEKLPPDESVSVDDLHVTPQGASRFASLDERGQLESEFVVTRRASDQYGASIEQSEADFRTEFLRFDEQGNMVLTAALDDQERALTEFNPPLILMPKQLRAHSPVTSESSMRVLDSENPSKVREVGKGNRTIEYVANERVRTPRGEFVAMRVEVEFKANLRMAEVVERTTMFIVPGVGLVAQQSSETVKVLGFGGLKKRTIVRIE